MFVIGPVSVLLDFVKIQRDPHDIFSLYSCSIDSDA